MKHVAKDHMTRAEAISLIADGARKMRSVLGDMYPALRSQRPTTVRSIRSSPAGWHRELGNFLISVAKASDPTAPAGQFERLKRASNEGDPTAGGFLVPEYLDQNLKLPVTSETSVLAPLVDHRETDQPLASHKIPAIDETSRIDGFQWGGVAAYWEGESAQVPNSLAREKMIELSGKKVIALTRASRELMNDAPLLGSVVSKGFAAVAGFKLDAAILAGTGAGQPLGILNSSCLITVPKRTGQAAATIVGENVSDMWSRLPVASRRRAVWLCNEDAEGQFENLGGASGGALYMPQGAGGNPYPLLKGRPVLVLEQSPILGAIGDITVVDLSQYILLDGGIKSAISVDAHFDTDEVTFRFTWRVDGKGAYSSPIAPFNGSSTRSPFVALGAR